MQRMADFLHRRVENLKEKPVVLEKRTAGLYNKRV
jgi:hypothetical protein